MIHQEQTFAAPPDRVYRALMESEQHAAFTGGPAQISPDAGGAFSAHGGSVVGRNVELVPGRRIVQAWRIAAWPEGLYSVVRMELTAEGSGTRLVLDHSGVPAEVTDMISSGWNARYWGPLATYLS